MEYEVIRRNAAIAQKELKTGDKHPFWGISRPEHAAKMKVAMKGRKFTDEHKKSISASWQQSRLRVTCEKCEKTMTKSMHTRWHGEKCGLPPDQSFIEKISKPKTLEHRMKLSNSIRAYYETKR